MRLEWRVRSGPLAWWWGLLTIVSGANIAFWFLLYRELKDPTGGLGSPGTEFHVAALGGLCLWLRLQVGAPPRRRSANLLVRHLAIKRLRWPVRGNRGRDLLRGAVGDHPGQTGRNGGGGYHRQHRVGDRAVDPHCGVLLMVCGGDDQFLGNAIENSIWAVAFLLVGIGLGRLWGSSTVRFAWSSSLR